MRLPVLVFLAACGGSAKPTTTAPTTPGGTEEDWRAYLAQLAGTPCRWIPGASFLACTVDGEPTTTLLGWEASNRHYVAWRIDANGRVSVLPGMASNAGWTFEGPDGRIALTRSGATGWTASGLASSDVTLAVEPQPVPAASVKAASAEDWRSVLEGFVGTWTFTGTDGGELATAEVACAWIAAATFIVCKNRSHGGFELMGWEPHNQRFVRWAFAPKQPVADVMIGTRKGRDWTFASNTRRVTYGYESGIRRNFKEEAVEGSRWKIVADGAYETVIE